MPAANEPLAIVGMACRFPGRANDPAAFWKLLCEGVDAITEVPPTRWNAARFHHPNPAAPGRTVTRWGGFVENAEMMDAAFFGISPREAARMDPQHRWLAEVTWEAMEDAGLPLEQFSGTRTGVFVGISSSDYYSLMHRADVLPIDGYSNIGTALSIAANRLSFLFNLRGPSLTVDTACSSSLLALHLAARSLWSGECEYTIVGGANALLVPDATIGFSHAHMLSPSGRCRAFDAGADGYVRAEGGGAILLMPLRAAQALGLHARALLLATASNQDGHSTSLTVPNQRAQEEMLREALRSANLRAGDVLYVEAHGTGTPVGDPIEARALAAVFGDGRPAGERLLVGSVKTNIGHLEPASGIAGLIKAVLVLEHRAVPPNLHFEKPNPLLPLDKIEVPVALTPLRFHNETAPLVAVNSFGFGGTNAHAILTSAPTAAAVTPSPDGPCIFPLSARSPAALTAYAEAFANGLKDAPSLREFCAAAALGKTHHPLRQAVVADSLGNLETQLRALREQAPKAAPPPPKIAFVFSGQGPQWWAMGRQLFREEKTVREMWERCDAVCRARGGPKLLDALLASEGSSMLNHTAIAQPALFTLQAGLVELWRSWGIEADAVLGHSVGEAAAAWASGSYDVDSIFRVIIARSRLQEKCRGRGRMLAAALSAEEAGAWEQKFGASISIAAFNSPRQVTLTGDPAALDEIAMALGERNVFHRFLNTDYAFHSAQMDAIEADLRRELGTIAGRTERVPLISTVTGQPQRGPGLDADYWWRNVRQPVRFGAAIEHLLDRGFNVFVEIGPHPVMASALTESMLARQATAAIAASLRREQDERATMLRALATLYRSGAQVRWEALYDRPSRRVSLPAYPWQRQRFWWENTEALGALRRPPSHPLLGDRQPEPQPSWLNHLDARLVPWLAEHRLGGSAVLPGAAYVEMAAAAVRELLGEPAILLEDIRFHRMLILPEEQPVATLVRLDVRATTFQIFSTPPEDPGAWVLHAEGIYRPGRLRTPPPADLAALVADFPHVQNPGDLYREAAAVGQDFGPAFQGLKSLRLRESEALGEVASEADRASRDYLLFPPLLDGCFHPWAGLVRGLGLDSQAVVASIAQVQLFAPLPEKVWSHVRKREADASQAVGDVTIYDPAGTLLARVNGMSVRRIDSNRAARERTYFKLAWEPAEALPGQTPPIGTDDRVLILADRQDAGSPLVEALRGRGVAATMVLLAVGDKDWASRLWEDFAAAGPVPTRVILILREDFGSSPAQACAALLALVQARVAIEPEGRSARWLVVTTQAEAIATGDEVSRRAAALWGFVRTVQTEMPDWNVTLVNCADAAPAEALLDELFTADIEPEVTLRADGRDVRRLRAFQPEPQPGTTHPPAFALEIGQTGRPDSLRFRGCCRPAPGAGEIEVEIAAAGLNFRDLMKVLGIYPLKSGERATLGDEFSGRIARVGAGVQEFAPGDRVMGIAPNGGAFGSHLLVPAAAVWKTPAHLSDAEAASIPVAFGTAHYALHTLARLRAGETVLIHAAAGGVGLAAVQLARRIGAVVFATAGSDEKREYLRSLGVAHVMDSRTLDFAEETLRHTGGRGVDVVLNSLAGAFQQKSLDVCAPCGRFVEIGKRDLFENRGLPLAAFQRSLTFSAFDLGAVIASRGDEWPALRHFFAGEFAPGKLEPIRRTTIPVSDAIPAFRLMQSAQHIGKIVLEFGGAVPEVPAEFWPKADGTWLVTGGLSGFGLATARWLAERGAGHLALLSLSGKPPPEDAPALEEMRARGVSITTLAADVADSTALAEALRTLANSAPPLRGVFHAAAVLRDRALESMTAEDLDAVLAPKIAGAWNLHEQTRELPLDCFVMFSSIASILGSHGQANYAAANAFLDALAQLRRRAGLPGLAVNWGQIADVGAVARRPELSRYLDSIGIRGMSSKDALARLALLIVSPESQVGVMDVDWDRLGRTRSKFKQSPLFRDLVSAGKADGTRKRAASEWRKSILSLQEDEQFAAVSELICGQLAATLGLPPGDIDPARPLAEFGMDSLMAVELKSRIESQAGVELAMNVFSADLTARSLSERFLAHLKRLPAESSAPSDPATAPAATAAVAEAEAAASSSGVNTSSAPVADAAPHWSSAGSIEPQGLAHPLQAARPGYVFHCFREYGAPDARLRFWFRTFNVLWACVARTPFRIVESWQARRLTERHLPVPPVFIIGHWRSGTTHLHRLLSQDPQFGFVTLLQATFPSDFITPFHRLLLSAILQERRPMDAMPVSQDLPEEEELAMASLAPASFFHAFYFPRAGRRIYRKAVHFEGVAPEQVEAWWSTYAMFLKKVQFEQPGRRLLLKNPANTARLSVLRARFPDAKFIHIHRHPDEVFASTLYLHRQLQRVWALQEDDIARLRETVLANYADLMSAYFEQSRGLAERELIEIRMDDLDANPLATIESIYRQLELPGFGAASPHFAAYLEKAGAFERNRLGLTPEERSAVRAALAPVFERWGYR